MTIPGELGTVMGVIACLVGVIGLFRLLFMDAKKNGSMQQDITTIKDGITVITKQIDKFNDNFNSINKSIAKLEVRVDNLEK